MRQLRYLLHLCAFLGIYTEYAQLRQQQEKKEKRNHLMRQMDAAHKQQVKGIEQPQCEKPEEEDGELREKSRKQKKRSNLTPLHCLHSLCVLIISWLTWLYIFLMQYNDDGFLLTWLVATIIVSSQTLTNALIMLESFFMRDQHDDFIKRISNCEDDLAQLYLSYDQQQNIMKTNHQKLCKHLNIFAVVTVLCWLIFMCFASKTYMPSYFWLGLFSNIIIRARILQIFAYVHLLLPYIECFNAKLKQVVLKQYCRFDNNVNDLDNERHLNSSIALFQNLRRYYANVYDAITALNRFAGCSLFSIIACYFLDFTCHLYWTLLSLDKVLPLYSAMASVATLLHISLVVGCFCTVCQTCKTQGMRARLLNNKLLADIATSKCLSRAYVNLVYEFGLQLRHQTLTVSAMHFFNIDLRLIALIFVSIATYLVILIQFLNSGTSK